MRYGSLGLPLWGRLTRRLNFLFLTLRMRNGLKILPALPKLALSIGSVFVSTSLAFGQGGVVQEDQIPWGPQGTIGRGYDTYSGFYGPSNPTYTRGYSSTPMTYSARAVSGPYLTNRYYEPGDGYRYPLYYNPATGTYFYYIVRR